MLASDIRRSFVDFFESKGHACVPSSSLVPLGDPTLLFTNAGMVQFKAVFQGLETRDPPRAVTVQKCVRAGGKHNDLEQVGHTARHHTFFEMLGNFSFGDYFKRGAIEYAWEWVTSEQYLGIHPDRVYVTVHHEDDEARDLWHEVTGMDRRRIYGMGDADNFWQMGDTGPCGPCSEIFVDLELDEDGRRRTSRRGQLSQAEFEALGESGDLLEIWNLVFMQFDQAEGGARSPLPQPSVDTGAGLERIAAVMQSVPSNYDTDLFMDIIRRAAQMIGVEYDRGPRGAGLRVLADHARAVAFLLADGVYPASDGRGYVLRRILRRAVRHAYMLNRREPTLVDLTGAVVEQMGGVFPELEEKASHIEKVTRAEEERFLETIEDGLRRLDEDMSGPAGVISGEEAFKLYDTYGFPIDLTQVIARERGWSVDVRGFEVALARQRERSRSVKGLGREGIERGPRRTARTKQKWTTVIPRKRQRFVGYETTETDTEILKFRRTPDRLELLLRENPFYSESGGQVSDTGIVHGEGWDLAVDEVSKDDGKQIVSGPYEGDFEPTGVRAVVEEPRRRDIERNHTATHLVHAALRNALGTHVRQAGSVVAPNRLRFDFSHHAPLSEEELGSIEEEVNRAIWANVELETREMWYDDAIAAGAMALFGEKYGDVVRVVDFPGLSVELCGGTHVRSTGQIGLFQFSGESGVASGVRRIEAVTGSRAYDVVKMLDARVAEVAERLRTSPEHVGRKIEGLLEEKRKLEEQLTRLLRSDRPADSVGAERHQIGSVSVIVDEAPVEDRAQIGHMMDAFREQHRDAVKILFIGGERPGIHAAVTDDLVSQGVQAGKIVQRLAAVSGGRGGGRPHFASAGIGDSSKLAETRARTRDILAEVLGSEAH